MRRTLHQKIQEVRAAMKVLLLDGYSLMYRAYHALSSAPMTAPDGTPTTAVHGFAMMLLRLIAAAAMSGVSVTPKGESAPAATGMQMTL